MAHTCKSQTRAFSDQTRTQKIFVFQNPDSEWRLLGHKNYKKQFIRKEVSLNRNFYSSNDQANPIILDTCCIREDKYFTFWFPPRGSGFWDWWIITAFWQAF